HCLILLTSFLLTLLHLPRSTLFPYTTLFRSSGPDGTALAEGPFTPKPKITTGAGDHFNSGFCLGKLLGFSTELCLLTGVTTSGRSEEHTSELQSLAYLVCRLLLEKKKK